MSCELKETLEVLKKQWKNRADHHYSEARKSDGISEHDFHENIAFGRLSDRAHKEFSLCLEYYNQKHKKETE